MLYALVLKHTRTMLVLAYNCLDLGKTHLYSLCMNAV